MAILPTVSSFIKFSHKIRSYKHSDFSYQDF